MLEHYLGYNMDSIRSTHKLEAVEPLFSGRLEDTDAAEYGILEALRYIGFADAERQNHLGQAVAGAEVAPQLPTSPPVDLNEHRQHSQEELSSQAMAQEARQKIEAA
jgi:hypothetical protein